MTPEQYAVAQAAISAAAADYAARFASLFTKPVLSAAEWLALLRVVYPTVVQFREQSAQLARQFYDEQRELFHPDLPRNDRLTEPFEFDWFVESMTPVRKKLSVKDSPKVAVTEFSLQVVREVENAGRRQIIHAVEADDDLKEKLARRDAVRRSLRALQALDDEDDGPRARPDQTETRPVQGWARVATGRETCEWCLMLVSRGPVYYSPKSAGLQLDEESARDAYLADQDVSEFMNEWHTGCDCKVVPVFDLEAWPGKDAQERAEGLWIKASRRATRNLEANPDKQYYSFKEKRWLPTTQNRETINQLRKMIDAGEVNPNDWAVLNQAA